MKKDKKSCWAEYKSTKIKGNKGLVFEIKLKSAVFDLGIFASALFIFLLCWPVSSVVLTSGSPEQTGLRDAMIFFTPFVLAFACGVILGRSFVWQISLISTITAVAWWVVGYYDLSQIEGGWEQNGGIVVAIQQSAILISVCSGLAALGSLMGHIGSRLYASRLGGQ